MAETVAFKDRAFISYSYAGFAEQTRPNVTAEASYAGHVITLEDPDGKNREIIDRR